MNLVPTIAALSLLASGCTQNEFETNIPPEEHTQIAEITDLTPKMQDKRRPIQGNAVLRGVHAKSHGCVAAEFKINEDLEDRYRIGLFADRGKTFNAVIRYSNAAVHTGDDLAGATGRENGSRGMAVKVLDVGGAVILKDKGEENQDFLMINTPEFAFRNTKDYLRLSRALHESEFAVNPQKYFDPNYDPPRDPDEMKDVVAGIQASAGVIGTIKSEPVRNPLQVQYFGAAPFLFGKGQVMKFSAKPCGSSVPQPDLTERELATPPSPGALPHDYLREALTATAKENEDVCFDFMIQVRGKEDVDRLNIDDATTRWPDELANCRPVAKIVITTPQQPDSPAAMEKCEALAFTPWHTLKEHRPVGSINRLRKDVYTTSAVHRRKALSDGP